MPTNFTVSTRPALRCVAGEAYGFAAEDGASGFFARLRVAERLVIRHGCQPSLVPEVNAWLDQPAGFRKKIFHA